MKHATLKVYNNFVNKYSGNYANSFGIGLYNIPSNLSSYGIIANNTIKSAYNDGLYIGSVANFSGLIIVNNYFTASRENYNGCCYADYVIDFYGSAVPNTFISNNKYIGYDLTDQPTSVYSSDNTELVLCF